VGVTKLTDRTFDEECNARESEDDSARHFGSPQQARNPSRVTNIYSTILAGIQNVELCKTQSENESVATTELTASNVAITSNLEKIFEEESSSQALSELPDLQSVKRLSCFEEICPSNEAFEDEDDGMYALKRFASEGVAALESLMMSPHGLHSHGPEETKFAPAFTQSD